MQLLTWVALLLWSAAPSVAILPRLQTPEILSKPSRWAGPVEEVAAELAGSLDVRSLQGAKCSCNDRALCDHVKTVHDQEFFGFSAFIGVTPHWRLYNWTHLTTVAWLEDPELVCEAHKHDARVVMNAGPNVSSLLSSREARVVWVWQTLEHILMNSLDGVNFDYEAPQLPGSVEAAGYTELVQLTSHVLHTVCPGCQVSVDVPWSPYDVDGRNFDWLGLSKAADLLFIMAYDMQSQIWGRCVASANCPFSQMMHGLNQWLNMGVPKDKMILGLPWYGYAYPCVPDAHGAAPDRDVDVCTMQVVPFTGAACSDAAGMQLPYLQLMAMIRTGMNSTAIRYDDVQLAPTFNYIDEQQGVHQVWFDTPESLRPRYQKAKELGLRGCGCWNLEWLYVSALENPQAREDALAMWHAVDEGFFSLGPFVKAND